MSAETLDMFTALRMQLNAGDIQAAGQTIADMIDAEILQDFILCGDKAFQKYSAILDPTKGHDA